MLLIFAGVLIVLWLLGFTVFHVLGWFIHLLLVVAIITILLRLIRGK